MQGFNFKLYYNSKTKDKKNMNDKNINNFKLDIRLCNSIDKSKIP